MRPIIFLFPVIALVLAVMLYFSLFKKTTDKKVFNRYIFIITVLAYLLNFAWELIQIPLYKNASFNFAHITFCALASFADVIMVLLLYFGFAFIFRNLVWIQHSKWWRIVIVIITGAAGAMLAEIRHLSLGSWAYADSMPIIPIVNVGISPVLQFMILPLLVYLLSFYCLKIMEQKNNYNGNYQIK